ncbi:MAG: ParB/RepB/Spo0J family partition protein [Oscillospiraceae bacterium]|nr:ParB/RepB/Spo0J family partition protein [Oscillospiraceae bacterium]
MKDEKDRQNQSQNAAGDSPGRGLSNETVISVRLSDLYPFPNHPFQVREDEAMRETAKSVRDVGVLTPAIVRPRKEGGYEIISGHRRKRACELAGIETMPAIVRDMDDDMAIITMVDSNLQRENILPSERAWAYKMKLDAIKRRSGRRLKSAPLQGEKNGAQLGHHSLAKKSVEIIAEESGASKVQIQRYIRLTELSPPLLRMVDERKIALTAAVEISYLKPEEQSLLVEAIEAEQSPPSLAQTRRMRQLSKMGALDEDTMLSVMRGDRKQGDLTISGDKLSKYFPPSCTPHEMEETIFKLLETWQRSKNREKER